MVSSPSLKVDNFPGLDARRWITRRRARSSAELKRFGSGGRLGTALAESYAQRYSVIQINRLTLDLSDFNQICKTLAAYELVAKYIRITICRLTSPLGARSIAAWLYSPFA